MEEMQKLRAAASDDKKTSMQTPPPKIPAPSPTCKPNPQAKAKASAASATEGAAVLEEGPTTEAAKLQRLRRLCEVKPSGKCSVPESIHLKWKNGSKKEREALVDELEKAGWSKECVIFFYKPI